MTTYLVFRKTEEQTWDLVQQLSARSAKSAIRETVLGEKLDGYFAAVPARSWRPVTVKTETKTQLTFS